MRCCPAKDLTSSPTGGGQTDLPRSTVSAGDDVGRQRLLNPGSPTDKRTQPHHTLALLDLEDGKIQSTQIVALD